MTRSLCLLFLLVSPAVLSATYVTQPVSYYLKSAEVVARIGVTKSELLRGRHEGKNVGCGQRVVADVVEAFKGNAITVEFIADGSSFHVGEEYFVFLDHATASRRTPMLSRHSLERNEAIRAQACSTYQKGYVASWLTTSEFVHAWSEETQKYEPWLVPAYGIEIPNDANIVFREVKLRALTLDGKVVEREYWSVDQGVPMPNVFWMYGGAYDWQSYRKYILDVASADDN